MKYLNIKNVIIILKYPKNGKKYVKIHRIWEASRKGMILNSLNSFRKKFKYTIFFEYLFNCARMPITKLVIENFKSNISFKNINRLEIRFPYYYWSKAQFIVFVSFGSKVQFKNFASFPFIVECNKIIHQSISKV